MLGGVGVGAGDEHAPLRELGEGRPDLLPGDDPFVAVLDRARLQRGEVGAGLGLGEALAPDLLGGEDRLQVALLLLVGAVGDDDRAAHRQAEDVGRARRLQARGLADEDRLLDHRRAAAAVLLRPGDPGPAGLVQLVLPLAAEGDHLVEAALGLGPGWFSSSQVRTSSRKASSVGDRVRSIAAEHIGGLARRPVRLCAQPISFLLLPFGAAGEAEGLGFLVDAREQVVVFVREQAGSSSPFSSCASAFSKRVSYCSSSPSGAPSSLSSSICFLTDGIDSSPLLRMSLGRLLLLAEFVFLKNFSNPALISLLPAAQIAFPCLRNSALVSDAVDSVVLSLLPQPAAIRATARTPASSAIVPYSRGSPMLG